MTRILRRRFAVNRERDVVHACMTCAKMAAANFGRRVLRGE